MTVDTKLGVRIRSRPFTVSRLLVLLSVAGFAAACGSRSLRPLGGGGGASGASAGGTGSGGAAGTTVAAGAAGATGAAGSGTDVDGGFGQPICPSNAGHGWSCTPTDIQLCYKTCGPEKQGVKSVTCVNSNGGYYGEMSGCCYDPSKDYSCYKIPTAANTTCPLDANAGTGAYAVPQGAQPCTVDHCVLCNSAGGIVGGIFFDSTGAAKSGYCVCQPPDASGTRLWSCASDSMWPYPGTPGCGTGPGAAGAGGGTGSAGGASGGGAGVGSGGAGGGTVPGCDALPASALCSLNPTGQVAVQSMSDLVAAIEGSWLLCGHESVFAVNGGDVGLEITADNHWYKLFAAQGAATIRGAGFDEEGTWTATDLGDHFQVSFNIFGGGSIYPAPVFASTPRAMRLNNNGVFKATYVIDPAVPVGTVRCASSPAR